MATTRPSRTAKRRGRAWVGTAGWTYKDWRGPFYPPGLPSRDWLPFYAEHLGSVEVNSSFYRLPPEAMIRGWLERVPEDFLFATKAWRAITHFRRLADCDELTARMLARLAALGPHWGPLLFQLPPRFPVDLPRLAAFLERLPADRRCAFEFRDPSWHADEVYALLARHNAAFCPFELVDLRSPRVVTADFAYVRLHGRKARYKGDYSKAILAGWARWLRTRLDEGQDVYVYFDNTDEDIHAIRNAEYLADRLAEAPAPVSRGRAPRSPRRSGTGPP